MSKDRLLLMLMILRALTRARIPDRDPSPPPPPPFLGHKGLAARPTTVGGKLVPAPNQSFLYNANVCI